MKNCGKCILKEVETMRLIIADINQRADWVEETLKTLIEVHEVHEEGSFESDSKKNSDNNSDNLW